MLGGDLSLGSSRKASGRETELGALDSDAHHQSLGETRTLRNYDLFVFLESTLSHPPSVRVTSRIADAPPLRLTTTSVRVRKPAGRVYNSRPLPSSVLAAAGKRTRVRARNDADRLRVPGLYSPSGFPHGKAPLDQEWIDDWQLTDVRRYEKRG